MRTVIKWIVAVVFAVAIAAAMWITHKEAKVQVCSPIGCIATLPEQAAHVVPSDL